MENFTFHSARTHVICGNCHESMNSHPHKDCPRTHDSFPFTMEANNDSEVSSIVDWDGVSEYTKPDFSVWHKHTRADDNSDYYFNFPNWAPVLIEDFSGPAAQEYITDDYDPSYHGYDDSVETWRDTHPNEFATTLEENAQTTPDLNDQGRNAVVEGDTGYLIVKAVDEALTLQYGQKLLNYFNSKNTMRIGSMEYLGSRINSLNKLYAAFRCVKCKELISINITDSTRNEAEDFIYNVIRHGNNHAANWMTQREGVSVKDETTGKYYQNRYYQQARTVYFGDINVTWLGPRTHNNQTHYTMQELSDALKADENMYLAFLKEHQIHCTDNNCKCEQYIWSLSPKQTATA